jgi:hypothetical protein
MRRLAVIGLVLVAVVAVVIVVVTSSSGGGDPYQVRAIFDDASFAAPGEDVRIAGAPVSRQSPRTASTNRSGRTSNPGTSADIEHHRDWKAGHADFVSATMTRRP